MQQQARKQYTDTYLWFWRTERGLSLEELARRVGVHKVHLCNVERGNTNPSKKLQVALADELGVDVGDVFPPPGTPSPREVLRFYHGAKKKHRAQVRELAKRRRARA